MDTPTEQIRPYHPADRDEVLALAPRLMVGVAPWRDQDEAHRAVRSWVVDGIDGIDAATAPILVAVHEGHVVGFVTTGTRPHWCGEVDAYVGELVVGAQLTGHGVGRALMSAAEDWARGAGHHRLTIETGAANQGARAFYAAAGYVEEEVVLTRHL